MIKSGNEGWEEYVPNKVAKAIKKNSLFNYPSAVESDKKRKKGNKNLVSLD